MFQAIWDNWLLIVFVAPALWALINLMDLYFIGDVYANEYEGAIITGFIQVTLWLLVPFLGLKIPDNLSIFLAMLAGFLLIVSYFFYFKALFQTKDASFILILWNMTAILTPFLAFFFLEERMSLRQYLGAVVVLFGVFIVSFHKKIKTTNFKKIIFNMSVAVVFFSFNMILARQAYEQTEFFSGVLFYSLGAVIGALFFYLLNYFKNHFHNCNFLTHSCSFFRNKKVFAKWFILIEVVSFSGVITAQRAIDLGPSVSVVAVIESIQPAFIIIFSLLFYVFALAFLKHKKNSMKFFHNEQLVGLSHKLVAIVIMALGIFLLN